MNKALIILISKLHASHPCILFKQKFIAIVVNFTVASLIAFVTVYVTTLDV